MEVSFDVYVQTVMQDREMKSIEEQLDEFLIVDWLEECYNEKKSTRQAIDFVVNKARTYTII